MANQNQEASTAPKARCSAPCRTLADNHRSIGSAVVACTLVLMSIPSCSAAGKARFLSRVDRGGLAFARLWNSTPKAADLPLQKGRCTQTSGQRKSLANVHCQMDNKPRNVPAMLNHVKSNVIGVCKAIPTMRGAIAAAALAAVWYMYPTLASAADVSLVAAGKLAAAATAPALQFASFLPPGQTCELIPLHFQALISFHSRRHCRIRRGVLAHLRQVRQRGGLLKIEAEPPSPSKPTHPLRPLPFPPPLLLLLPRALAARSETRPSSWRRSSP